MMALVAAEKPSTSTSPPYYYDVFVSFKRKDTLKTFTGHLHAALLQLGLSIFTNTHEYHDLQTDEAIRRSKISVIVLSENYASSKRCLHELFLILECRKRFGQFVLPLFYRIDPSEILRQSVEFRAEFDGRRDDWRSVLGEVAKLASEYGMNLHNFAQANESEFVQKIVNVIEDKLSWPIVRVARYPIGIDLRARNINLWLQQKATNVELLVICGMGGIGKTTIAKYLYNLNFRRFQCSSFLANVRETSEQPHGLVKLQNQLLSNVNKGKMQKVWNVDEGIIKIKEVLSHKRSLLVLDDVDEMYQLDALIGKREFHRGTKIIITTRKKWFLRAHDAYNVHAVENLDENESLELFSWHAFGKKHPAKGYVDLSECVARHCLGIPLALVVLGSSLAGRSTAVWTSTLEKLKAIPDGKIIQKLNVSYESLRDDHDKNLFLHIACFFVGEDKDCVAKILDKCDFFSIVGIQNLIDRCLINLDLGKLRMHHLIQEMAREIVRKESPTDPGERSRLWHHVDSFSVLKEKTGTERIQGLMLDMRMVNKDKSGKSRKRKHELCFNEQFLLSKKQRLTIFYREWVHNYLKWPNEMDLEIDAFGKMRNLKLLGLNYVQLTGCYDKFPQNLRWLSWHGFPLTFVPTDLRMRNLISLDLSHSNLKQVWKQTKLLGCLKILNLSYSRRLTETPNFSGLPSLEKLMLKGCIRVVTICESIKKSEFLTLLDLEDCKKLINLPQTLWKLRFLETLNISGCSSLREFPMNLSNMESLKELCADGITIINPSLSVARENKWWCPFVWSKPRKNPDVFWTSLPCSLVKLHLANSNLSQDSFPRNFSNLSSLTYLNLSENPIRVLPDAIRSLCNLVTLDLSYCPDLHLLLDVPRSLESLYVDDCKSLERISGLSVFALLMKDDCSKLVDVEDYFRLEPIMKVNPEIIDDLGFISVELLADLKVYLHDGSSYYTGNCCIQGLFQYGIFSMFIQIRGLPRWFSENKVSASSVSFTVPLDAIVKCLNICCVYRDTEVFKEWMPNPAYAKIHNKSKNLTWIYCPAFIGLSESEDLACEDLAWLSQWKFGSHLESGDEVTVSFIFGDCFQVKECGANLVQEVNEDIPPEVLLALEKPDEIVDGDYSEFELIDGVFFIFHDRFRHIDIMEDCMPFTELFWNVFGDSAEAIGAVLSRNLRISSA